MDVTTQQLTVPYSRLVRDEANVRRKYDGDSIASMKASILAGGIIQPLAVRPPQEGDADLGGQLYRVFAGGRRLRALAELVKEQLITADYPVPIIVRDVDDRLASEMSLTENIIRRAMEPVDEFRAFKELADQGLSVPEIALRFGQTERFVKGRLALGNVHPEILAAYEAGEFKLETVMAYTVSPDPEKQVEYFRANRTSWMVDHPHYIRHAMRGGDGIKPTSKLAQFIGEEPYLAAGGHVSEDLFGDNTVWASVDVIDKLKAEKFEAFKQASLADGWSFVETTEQFGLHSLHYADYLQPEGASLTEEQTARMDEIAGMLESGEIEDEDEAERLEAEYQAFENSAAVFTAEQKAASGILFDLERCEWRAGATRAIEGKSNRAGTSKSAPAPKERDPLALTQPLRDLIGDTATAALKSAAVANPHQALALLAAMLEQHQNHSGTSRPSRLKVERIDVNYGAEPERKERTIKAAAIGYAKMTSEELVSVVAGLFASTIDLTEKWLIKDFNYSHPEKRDDARLEHLALFEAKPVEAFDPDAYFTACTKPMIDAAMREMTTYGATKPKKADMAKDAAAEARRTGWLPAPLRLKGYALKGAKPAKEKAPKKSKKAA